VQAAVAHLHSDCFWLIDGGKRKLDIEVFKEDGLSLGVFETHKKLIPHFSIYPKNKKINLENPAGGRNE
jgi:hypothetical protein